MSAAPHNVAFKVCTLCGVEKMLELFDRQKSGPLGRRCACKVCRLAAPVCDQISIWGMY